MSLKLRILKFVSKYTSKKPNIGVGLSFDSKTNLKKLPGNPLLEKGKFLKLDKKLINFEVVKVNKASSSVLVREICTDNEFEISFELFDYLFYEAPTPVECKF